MIGSIVIFGALLHCALLHSVDDVKAAQMNMQHSLIQEYMLYEIEQSYNAIEATKNTC